MYLHPGHSWRSPGSRTRKLRAEHLLLALSAKVDLTASLSVLSRLEAFPRVDMKALITASLFSLRQYIEIANFIV